MLTCEAGCMQYAQSSIMIVRTIPNKAITRRARTPARDGRVRRRPSPLAAYATLTVWYPVQLGGATYAFLDRDLALARGGGPPRSRGMEHCWLVPPQLRELARQDPRQYPHVSGVFDPARLSLDRARRPAQQPDDRRVRGAPVRRGCVPQCAATPLL